jgi:hypothetical protein
MMRFFPVQVRRGRFPSTRLRRSLCSRAPISSPRWVLSWSLRLGAERLSSSRLPYSVQVVELPLPTW